MLGVVDIDRTVIRTICLICANTRNVQGRQLAHNSRPRNHAKDNNSYFKFNAVDGYPESKRITDLPLSHLLCHTRITATSRDLLPGRHPSRPIPLSQTQSTHSAIDPCTLLSKQLLLQLTHHVQLAQDTVNQ